MKLPASGSYLNSTLNSKIMNYVKHLNEFLERIKADPRLNPTHVSLYFSLCRIWNISRFADSFFINREEVMVVAKIGSKATYHRCISHLNEWGYIKYYPSRNPYKGSRVKILDSRINLKTNSPSTDPINDQSTSNLKDEIR